MILALTLLPEVALKLFMHTNMHSHLPLLLKLLLVECYHITSGPAAMQRSLTFTWHTPRIRKMITGIRSKLQACSKWGSLAYVPLMKTSWYQVRMALRQQGLISASVWSASDTDLTYYASYIRYSAVTSFILLFATSSSSCCERFKGLERW